MSMDFFNTKDRTVTFSINNRGWHRIYLLGLIFGWVPQGTTTPHGWRGENPWDAQNYTTNDGQVVTADDPLELARAIEQAIPLLKASEPSEMRQKTSFTWELELYQRFARALENGVRDPGYIFFDTRWSEKLNELVTFCRKGAFKIC